MRQPSKAHRPSARSQFRLEKSPDRVPLEREPTNGPYLKPNQPAAPAWMRDDRRRREETALEREIVDRALAVEKRTDLAFSPDLDALFVAARKLNALRARGAE